MQSICDVEFTTEYVLSISALDMFSRSPLWCMFSIPSRENQESGFETIKTEMFTICNFNLKISLEFGAPFSYLCPVLDCWGASRRNAGFS